MHQKPSFMYINDFFTVIRLFSINGLLVPSTPGYVSMLIAVCVMGKPRSMDFCEITREIGFGVLQTHMGFLPHFMPSCDDGLERRTAGNSS